MADRILGIETSCDETAAAVVDHATHVRSSVVASQIDQHARYGGVVPEIASRAHVEMLTPVIAQALVEAGVADDEIDAVAATTGPGLVGSLLVGVSAAKALALVWDVPFVAVNHLEGHLYAAFLEEPDLQLPLVVLLVSGGHTMLVHIPELHRHEILGQTLDDAAGEAFDKVARLLGLGFPGGPALDALAAQGDPTAVRFPRSMADSGDLDFSMSGLKTAVLRHLRAEQAAGRDISLPDVAASFREAIVDVQVSKTIEAANGIGVETVLLGGGVVANTRLRERMTDAGARAGLRVLYPPLDLCTDNAAMIAVVGSARLARGERSSLDIAADPNLRLAP
jgi:N6-L-threonylcarbamoyladenine synthase